MGKVRTRIIGLEEVEKSQKKKQKDKSLEKKKKTEEIVVEEPKTNISVEPQSSTKPVEQEEKKARKSRARARGKKYQKAKEAVDKSKTYSTSEAIKFLKKIKYTAFDESVELHLNVVKEGLRGEVQMPYKTGKTIRVKVVDDAALEEIESGKIEFDVLVTHPSYMPRLAKFAKILGPRGLMPNPKVGTISDKPEEVVKKFTSGVIRWKSEAKAPLVHQAIGKISYEEKDLDGNIKALIKAIGLNNINEAFIKTTMSPSIRLSLEKI